MHNWNWAGKLERECRERGRERGIRYVGRGRAVVQEMRRACMYQQDSIVTGRINALGQFSAYQVGATYRARFHVPNPSIVLRTNEEIPLSFPSHSLTLFITPYKYYSLSLQGRRDTYIES